MSKPFLLAIFVCLVAAIIGVLLVVYASQNGPWAASDSVEYLEAARNFSMGRGLVLERPSGRVVPLYFRPPLYSIFLGLLININIDPIAGTVWLNVIMLSLLLVILGLFSFVRTSTFPILTILVLTFLLTNNVLIRSYTGMMSEPLFISLTVLQIGVLVLYFHNNRLILLTISALLAGLSLLTRYAGLASIVTGILGLLLFSKNRRLKGSTLFLFISTTLFVIWSVSIYRGGVTPGVYDFGISNLWEKLGPVRIAFVNFLWSWLPLRFILPDLGYRGQLFMTIGFHLVLGIIAMVWLLKRNARNLKFVKRNPGFQFSGQLLVFSLLHALMIATTYVVVEAPKPALIPRILLPSQITYIVGLVLLCSFMLWYSRWKWMANLIPIVLLAPPILGSFPLMKDYINVMHDRGMGYTSRQWEWSEVIEEMRGLSSSIDIVTNDVNAVMFFAHRPAFPLPELEAGSPVSEWNVFGEGEEYHSEKLFRQNRAALVLFGQNKWPFVRMYGENADARLEVLTQGLFVIYQGDDGGIYLYQSPSLE